MIPTGLSTRAPLPYGRDNQSIAFFRTAGSEPLFRSHHGTASADATAARTVATLIEHHRPGTVGVSGSMSPL